jgi:hypothetical protein
MLKVFCLSGMGRCNWSVLVFGGNLEFFVYFNLHLHSSLLGNSWVDILLTDSLEHLKVRKLVTLSALGWTCLCSVCVVLVLVHLGSNI